MKKIIVLFLALTFSFFAQAQNACGITREPAVQNILQSKALAKKHLTNGLPEDEKHIPIKFHLVGDTDDLGNLTFRVFRVFRGKKDRVEGERPNFLN